MAASPPTIEDPALAHGLGRAVGRRQAAQLGAGGARQRGHGVGDDLDDVARDGEAEAGLVGGVEGLPEAVDGIVVEGVGADRQLELVVLAEIAHLQAALDLDAAAVALLGELGLGLRDQGRHDLARPGRVEAVGW